ncbi:1-phosphofructokinase family hexose kinase [Lacticaseibacillus brantae]|uniref:Tagatose-6-phosphate kinase n=1 Tax=Lacticaseibacillus brantae DSM 23927 TaxID=1423727 RepID=A0A0R2AWR5_9LACO|nr:1-phosphofructokinase family hexose kinase [Lacticaseibacillus brantae]KRM71440.1 tagatose-6-phosphate kinase [Lacticaseibacillus brantae DSM 23927]
MILTITLNPSLDVVYQTATFKIGATNRELNHRTVVGGKGVNAARVSSILAGKTSGRISATGFIGKKNSDLILDELKNFNINNEFVPIDGKTRYCYTILDEEGTKTELNEIGEPISQGSLEKLLTIIDKMADLTAVSINGSVPAGLPTDTYRQILKHVKAHNPEAQVILDSSGAAFSAALQSAELPDIIKPNSDELGQLLNQEIPESPIETLRALQDDRLKGIPAVVVSLGHQGAALKIGTDVPHFYFVKTRLLREVNAEGSGDAVVGGMLYAIDQGLDLLTVIKYGMAAGMANVMEAKTGFVNPENVSAYVEDDSQIIFQEVNRTDLSMN